ncbi:hypothetical protein LshimejAT787_1801480 [Lyophyllum shimeji]|uniref:Uncharacterized protein n=1 Tax=Lyophyllum shimeji TaxID=47721 RepID=A0A9P3Q041_LYOSH|nr:hypothetical protein LshimejAT787_1801480 [Lyophyllum shimeji]
MRFSFTATTVVVLAATAFTGAAVIPRANVDLGLEARYYRGAVYAREIPPVPSPKVGHRISDDEDFTVVEKETLRKDVLPFRS